MWIILFSLIRVFAPLSLLTIGGGQSVIPAIHYQSVDVHQWLSNSEFIDLFALSRLTPGPKSLLVTLIGWEAAGLAGAIIATIAIFLPSALFVYGAARIWSRYEGSLLIQAIEQGLVPVAAGMIFAATGTILELSMGGIWAWAIAAVSGLLLLRTSISPFLLLAAGGILFMIFQPY